jgi:hypothetical protein
MNSACFNPSQIELPKIVEQMLREWLKLKNINKPTENVIKLLWTQGMQMMKKTKRSKKVSFFPAEWAQRFSRRYSQIFALVFKRSSHYSKDSGICKTIEEWHDDFRQIIIKCLETLINNNVGFKFPGADASNYYSTAKSKRLYHWMQNIPRSTKKKIFKGCADLDIVSAFPNIFLQRLVKARKLHPAFLQMVQDPKAFLKRIEDENVWTFEMRVGREDKSAKGMRSRLFSSISVPRIGVQWYDDLMMWIRRIFVEEGIINPHLFFTGIEREIIVDAVRLIGEDRVKLLMHDGLIVDGTEDMQELVSMLSAHTGYEWKAEEI